MVLVPFSIYDNIHAFLGPFPNPNVNTKKVREVFPCYYRTKPCVFLNQNYDMSFINASHYTFHSALYTQEKECIQWLDKVESKKAQLWKKQGIFDLMQLSRVGPTYSSYMLISILQFQQSSTNKFQLCYGIITPTLLDVAASTGL